jgi:UDP-N-acetylmuramoyl-L-alanyl-D-glutamate--2,6-diaminopimelate ligase
VPLGRRAAAATNVVHVTSPARPAAPPARLLADLLGAGGVAAAAAARVVGPSAAAVVLRGVTHDSRAVQPGDLYLALPGANTHGARFAGQALAAGASAVLTDAAGVALLGPDVPVPVVVADEPATPGPRALMGPVAAWLYGDPSAHLRLLGVTGTNGKTTVAYLLEAGLRAAGTATGLIGTVETRVAGQVLPSARTTPEASDLQALLALMVERGVGAAAMEVSSHALAQHRVDGARFAGAVFTNLSRDHLDYHPTMEDYFAAKARLFEPGRAGAAVVCVDTDWGRRLAAARPGAVRVASPAGRPGSLGQRGSTGRAGGEADWVAADWVAADVEASPAGSAFRALGPGGLEVPLRIALPGAFNVANALCALALLVATGVPPEPAAAGNSTLPGVPGRMERVEAAVPPAGGPPFTGIVDYAHTPDAVERLLATVRALVGSGRVLAVLGCGGDRDPGKRPLMGAAVAAGADVAILTSDNPRSEDPELILAAMANGARTVGLAGGEVVVEHDRAEAIALAVRLARPGDVVVVAGKGHERGQEIDGVVYPFDDREVLRAALSGVSA